MDYSKSIGIFLGVIGMAYKDRGDPANEDFDKEDLTIDGSNHPLDLSSIVPEAGANHLVHITATVQAGEQSDTVFFSKNGTSGAANKSSAVGTDPGSMICTGDIWVTLDTDRKIQYNAFSEVGFQAILITIRGWLED